MKRKHNHPQVSQKPSKIAKYGFGVSFAILVITFAPVEFPTLAQTKIIHVNVQTGDDRLGNGSQEAPLKTLSRALKIARPQTEILLAPGTYSAKTGEQFPLRLTTNVTIEGNPDNQGRNIIIQGNGTFTSPTSANQQATIVASDNAGSLTGVTVINPNPRGYGLWIESASPQITRNSFIRSGNGGISINGESAPLIANNYIFKNLGNGIVVYGRSQPQIISNTIEKTGFGVSVLQESQITLKNNQITGNRVGLVVESNAQATLRHNIIEFSTEDGIVIISNAFVDLGTAQQPGGNIFRRNRHTDIKNLASLQIIPASGNQISGTTTGRIDFAGRTSRFDPVATKTKPINPPPLPPQRSVTAKAPTSFSRSIPLTPPRTIIKPNNSLPPPPPTSTPTPTSTTTTNSKTNREGLLDLVFVAPNAASNINRQMTFQPDIPSAPKTQELAERTPVTLNSGYRVVAETLNRNQEKKVRSLYPDAFTTTYNGQPVWQVGVFQNRDRAVKVLENLNNQGISGLIVRL